MRSIINELRRLATAFFCCRKIFLRAESVNKNFWEVINLKAKYKKLLVASVAVGVLTPFLTGGGSLR